MGTSIQTIDQHSAILNDVDLLILMGLMVNQVSENPEAYSALDGFCRQWIHSRETYGPGTLDLNLQEISTEERSRIQFLRLLEDLKKRGLQNPTVLSADFLNTHFKVKGVRFFDCDADRILLAIDKLLALFQ